MPNYKQRLAALVDTVIAQGASDLHLSVGVQPTVRVSGVLTPLLQEPALTQDEMLGVLGEMISPERKQKFIDTQEADFSYAPAVAAGGGGRLPRDPFFLR